MSLSIQQSTDFSPASVQFSKLRKNKNGGKAVYLNAGDNKKLYIQFPFMRSPYGLSAFTDESTGRTSYSLDLSFDPDNADAMALHDKLKELDEKLEDEDGTPLTEWQPKSCLRPRPPPSSSSRSWASAACRTTARRTKRLSCGVK